MNAIEFIKVVTIITLMTLLSSQSHSENKIAFVEMELLINNSLAGKSLIKQLDELDKKNKKYFIEYKKKLSLEKEKINSQKNILSKEEYEKKVISLNKDFENFQNDGKKKIEILKLKRNKAMKDILSELNILLSEYSDENKLSFIIDNKNIIIGRSDLNITNEILKLLDKKLKKVSIN